MEALSKAEITEFLSNSLISWSYDEHSIIREFKFKNFVEAFSFMTAVAMEAEKEDHHPDWSNSYNRVNISLVSHDVGGITGRDLHLAKKIDNVFEYYVQQAI